MNLSDDILKQAEGYLNDTLSSDAKKAFELLLTENQELADYISINQEMNVQYNDQDWSFKHDDSEIEKLDFFFKSKEAKELKASFKNANDTFVKTKPSNKKNYFSYFAIAASIIVLVGYFMFNSTPQTNLEIYSDYKDWSNLPSLTTRGEDDNNLLVQGENAFLEKDYNHAANYFEAFLSNSENINANALLYLGVSNLELGNHEKALDAFNQLISSKTLDSPKGYWYKALTYLKMEDKVSTIQVLNILANDDSKYNNTEVLELLEKLKK